MYCQDYGVLGELALHLMSLARILTDLEYSQTLVTHMELI